mmetsp:Transcript_46602/g.134239  ORF Transcript_46602/g.134239 Transcript_46602/m.134239 type:complete len:104 (+) Transcript_46602:104-415(+)
MPRTQILSFAKLARTTSALAAAVLLLATASANAESAAISAAGQTEKEECGMGGVGKILVGTLCVAAGALGGLASPGDQPRPASPGDRGLTVGGVLQLLFVAAI